MAAGRVTTLGGILSRLCKQRFGDLTVILDRKGNVLDVNNDEMTLKVSVPVTVGFVIYEDSDIVPFAGSDGTSNTGTATYYKVYGEVPANAIKWYEWENQRNVEKSVKAGFYNGTQIGLVAPGGFGSSGWRPLGDKHISGSLGWNSVTEYQTKTVKIKNGKIVSVS